MAFLERADEGAVRAQLAGATDIIARFIQRRDDRMGARLRVQANRIAAAAAPRRIVREDKSERFCFVGLAPQARPICGERCDKGDAGRLRRVARRVELARHIALRPLLEGDRARENAAVHLGQHNIHREIRAAGPALRSLPRLPRRGGERGLQHRRIGEIENGALRPSRGEGRRVQNHVGLKGFQSLAQKSFAFDLLEARHIDGFNRESLRGERVGQRENRRRVAAQISGTIKDDQRARFVPVVAPRRLVAPRRGDGDRLAPTTPTSDKRIRIVEEARQILGTSPIEIGPNATRTLCIERRSGGEPRIVDGVARNKRQREIVGPRESCKLLDAIRPIVFSPSRRATTSRAWRTTFSR